ncbi:MAG: ABC transporter substrate-binding protein [Acidimicrobiia bacterium]
MRSRLRIWAGVVAVAAVTGALVAPAAAQSGTKPTDTEVGVSASEIHLAVIADVDNALAPGLFKGAEVGAQAAARYLNSKAGGGGVGGRKLVIDFYDSKLTPNDARNGVIKACQNDLALVGTSALFLTTVDDMVGCADKAGKPVGIPDIGGVVTGIPEACSPMSFPVIGSQIDCATITQNPQTYYGNQGQGKYLLRTHKGGLHGAFVIASDTKDANRGGAVLAKASQAAGIKADQEVTKSGRDPQSAYTGLVQQMKTDNSNYAQITLSGNSAIEFRDEAQLQGLSNDVVWYGTFYHDATFQKNLTAADGFYVGVAYLPFEEAKYNAMLRNFLKYVGLENADQFAVYAWSATITFAQAARGVVDKDGVNGLTRSSLIAGIKGLTDFDAGGMIGTHSFKTAKPTSCFIMTQVSSGKWKRLWPKKAGTFDCKPSNFVELKADLIGR